MRHNKNGVDVKWRWLIEMYNTRELLIYSNEILCIFKGFLNVVQAYLVWESDVLQMPLNWKILDTKQLF